MSINFSIPERCPSCEQALKIDRLSCATCGTSIEGSFGLPRLARLSKDDQQFIELLVLADGSLKSVSAKLKISYPTVRKRLDEVVERLTGEIKRDEKRRTELIKEVKQGKLSPEDALKQVD